MRVLRSELLHSCGFHHAFSLRSGGVSAEPYASLNLGRNVGDDVAAVLENHRRFAAEVGYAPERLFEVNQVHAGDVAVLEEASEPASVRLQQADALVSARAGCAIGVRVADCAAVLLGDPESGAVAAAHAGWRGVVAQVVQSAVRTLCTVTGALPARLVAASFPCIGVDAFEVGDEVAEAIAASVSAPGVVVRGPGRPHVDLARSVALSLAAAGVDPARTDHVLGCTFAEPALFFSHRRDRGLTGRHLAAIVPRC